MTDRKQGVAPVRSVHVDCSPTGARNWLRNKRYDIIEEGKDIIAAEDKALATGEGYEGRRYAIYSIWRPLKTVKRDSLIVCDIQSLEKEGLVESVNKQPGVHGDFLSGVVMISDERNEKLRWFWIREQEVDEVFFLQFYDSVAEREGRATGVPHGSPELIGAEGKELRESVEARVMAFW